jgi:hypothetical protein
MMLEISKAMKVGRVVLVEFRKEDEPVPIKLVHKMTSSGQEGAHLPELHLNGRRRSAPSRGSTSWSSKNRLRTTRRTRTPTPAE